MSIMGFFIFLIYTFIIVILLSSSRLRGKKSNQLLLNLSIGNMMTGAFHFVGMWTTFPIWRLVYVGIAYASVSMIVLSIDRCIYIVLPLRYDLIHRGWQIGFILVSPIFAMIALVKHILLGFDQEVTEDVPSTLSFILIVFAMTTMLLVPNLIVFRILRRQRAQIKVQCHSLKVSPPPPPTQRSSRSASDILRFHEVRSFYLCFGCVLTFLLCWLPQLAFKAYELSLIHI